ncbi:MAG TPA: glycoside hydrolase family 2 protein [Polyangia bacterium]
MWSSCRPGADARRWLLVLAACLGGAGWGASARAAGTALTAPATALPGPWWFRQLNAAAPAAKPVAADWLPAMVPGCVHTDLLANHRIPDPFAGTNEKDLQWIEKADWEYKTTLVTDPALLGHERVELWWKGLDTYAEVFVNGASVLTANNMFRQWAVDVKARLHTGDNEIVVRFRSPIAAVKSAYDRLGYVLPAVNDQAPEMVSMFTRKAPYHYGWDWGPRFVTSGIWRPVLVRTWDSARIEDVQVVQDRLADDAAALTVDVTVPATRASTAELTVSVDGAPAARATKALQPGINHVVVPVSIARPQRWWPNGLGPARLYDVAVALSTDGEPRGEAATRIGLRTVEVVHRRDKDGKSFTIKVNGVPVFMKGANYIPSDSFPSRVTPERLRALVQAAADANMNMLRVWGGGVYEDDAFYAECDRLGILVWQDFMFACSMYPGDDAFLANVRQEAIEAVRRLRNHPCLALWAGNNEIEAAWQGWGWAWKFHLSRAVQDKLWADYQHLFHQLLPSVIAAEDPGRFYTRSSPSANEDAVPANKQGWGDMHYWGVWHAEEPYTKYADNVSRFMSEYGFQSFPELSTVSRYAGPDERRIDSPVMLSHQRHPRGNQLIRTYMDRDFRPPKDFASFLYVSQVLQATVIKFGAEAHRRRMPYNAGSLYWQLDDCWPVASWSGIDYFGRWKALHYYARRFFAPVLVSPVIEKGSVRVYVVSDRLTDTPAQLSLRLIDFDGHERWRKDTIVTVASNSSRVYQTLSKRDALRGADPSQVVLVAELSQNGQRLSRNILTFVKARDLTLPGPELTTAVEGHDGAAVVRVTARHLASAVWLHTDGGDGAFTDNFFDLLPGETATVGWRPSAGGAVDVAALGRTLRATSLRDSY